ncbi:MAG: type II toxin-antitoxin system VapC family toxin [Solirubrobacteraceae bacterium]
MTLIADTGPIVAALNRDDPDHLRCRSLLEADDDVIVPGATLAEIDYWLRKFGAQSAWRRFVGEIRDGLYRVADPTEADLVRAAELEERYSDLRLGFVDASVIALCERLDQTRLATLDRRHFTVVKPRHCRTLTLLPA